MQNSGKFLIKGPIHALCILEIQMSKKTKQNPKTYFSFYLVYIIGRDYPSNPYTILFCLHR
jgi:hypothetical protein